MNPSNEIPSPQFEDREVDSLIANFGVELSPEKREELHESLGAQREVFMKDRGYGNGQDHETKRGGR